METLLNKSDLCEKIRALYPTIGECGIDIDVLYAPQQERWVVDLKRNERELKTYLEPGDAQDCLMGPHCIGLSFQVAQLVGNIERLP